MLSSSSFDAWETGASRSLCSWAEMSLFEVMDMYEFKKRARSFHPTMLHCNGG